MTDEIRRSKFGSFKVTSGVIAEVLGIKGSNVAEDEERFPPLYRLESGQRVYDLVENIHAHLKRIKMDRHAEDSIEGRRKKLLEEQERKLRMQNDERAAVTMQVDTTLALLQDIVNSIRGGADALPARVAQQFSGMTSPRVIRALLEEELNEIFGMAAAAISDYKKTAAERQRNSAEAKTTDGAAHPKTPRQKVSRRVGRRKSSPPKRKRRTRKVAK